MKKIIHINLVFVLLISSLWMKAQNVVRETWNDVDFSDTTLVDSESFRVRMVNELYLNTMTDDLARFDSLSIQSVGVLLDKAKVNMRVYEFLREPLIRRFGEEWYGELCAVADEMNNAGMLG